MWAFPLTDIVDLIILLLQLKVLTVRRLLAALLVCELLKHTA